MSRSLLLASLVVAAIVGCTLAVELNPRKVVYAVDCGSTVPTKSVLGYSLHADTGYSGGKIADYTLNQEASGATLKYTRDQPIYMTERHDDYTFDYKIPVIAPGTYVLILKFSELYFSNKGQRVFNILFGERKVASNIDIAGTVGKNAAYDVYIEFEKKDGLIHFENSLCTNAIDASGKLKVVFEKINIDNPKVDAIVLYQGSLKDTDYYEQDAIRRDWDRRYEEEKKRKEEERLKKEASRLKKKEKIKVRNDQADDFEEDFEDLQENDTDGGLLSYVISPGGFLLVGAVALVVYFIINSSSKNNAPKYPVETILSSGISQEGKGGKKEGDKKVATATTKPEKKKTK